RHEDFLLPFRSRQHRTTCAAVSRETGTLADSDRGAVRGTAGNQEPTCLVSAVQPEAARASTHAPPMPQRAPRQPCRRACHATGAAHHVRTARRVKLNPDGAPLADANVWREGT